MLPWSCGLAGCAGTEAEGQGRSPCSSSRPKPGKVSFCSQFPLTTLQTETWDFPLHVAKTCAADNRAKATPGLGHFPAGTHVPRRTETQTASQASALLSWSLSCCPWGGGMRNVSYLQRLQLWLEMTRKKLVWQKLAQKYRLEVFMKTLLFQFSEVECNIYATSGSLLSKSSLITLDN